jgi:hypothetical protein
VSIYHYVKFKFLSFHVCLSAAYLTTLFSDLDYITLNEGVISERWIKKDLPGGTEENNEILQLGQQVFELIFEPGISRILSKSVLSFYLCQLYVIPY